MIMIIYIGHRLSSQANMSHANLIRHLTFDTDEEGKPLRFAFANAVLFILVNFFLNICNILKDP